MSKRKAKFPIWLVYWYDNVDRLFRVAGVYDSERKAARRLKQLPAGTTQALTLNSAVRFTFETREKGD